MKIFLTKVLFLQFQKWPKLIFELKFKTAKNAISHKKNFDLFDFTSFFAWTFLHFCTFSIQNDPLCELCIYLTAVVPFE